MKRIGILLIAGLLFSLGATRSNADSLIVNGSFEATNTGGGWGFYANGAVPGWTTTDPGGLIEIDTSTVVGGPAYNGTQSLEVNANIPETVQQTVTGLVAGQSYDLSFAYGLRPGSGDEQMQVWFGSTLVTLDSDTESNGSLVWIPQNFVVTADGTSDVLSFVGLADSGLPSYGNEIDDVSLVATPEPTSLMLLGTGLALMAMGWAFGAQRKSLPATIA